MLGLGEVAGAAGVNFQGLAAFTGQGRGIVHVLVDDDCIQATRAALKQAHLGSPTSARCWWSTSPTVPGRSASSRTLAAANVNVDLAYTTFGGTVQIVIATDDLQSARAALA